MEQGLCSRVANFKQLKTDYDDFVTGCGSFIYVAPFRYKKKSKGMLCAHVYDVKCHSDLVLHPLKTYAGTVRGKGGYGDRILSSFRK